MRYENKYLKDNIILLNKNKGISSFKIINKLKWLLNANKVGHAGTLDPLAEGLMVVMLNGATKFSDYLMKKDKEYYVEFELGYETDTYDYEGEVIKKFNGNINLSKEKIEKIVNEFLGDIEQVPPMYSAIKINGEKLYNLARKGLEIERESRKVKIYYIKDIEYNEKINKISFTTGVSSGTYIRSLVHDIGEKIGVYATMTKLIRTKIDEYNLEDAILIEDVIEFFEKNENIKDTNEIDKILKIKSIESILRYESIYISNEKYIKMKNGMTVLINISKFTNINVNANRVYKIYNKENEFLGTGKIMKIFDDKVYIKRDKYFL
ncbi:MAG: tRNA pseudouridine(55) synthase TruB [Leptotrichiaceae bacterium]|nr:tRNA pseudouridine(55) synthase TruB [Leptotrichiaceae bacterium]MBP7739609.1 tRNA pseudouridine(55) synthase TruB [Leptotrichiaceae bacterium]